MKKLNDKGFVLVETLIVSVFVMALFTVLYTDLFPLLGEYQKRENYNDIDSKYIAHWVRKMVMASKAPALENLPPDTMTIDISDCPSTYIYSGVNVLGSSKFCQTLKEQAHITKMYVTSYDARKFKQYIKDTWGNNTPKEYRELLEYVNYLPVFDDTGKETYYRVIIEIDHETYRTFSTIEVMHE